MASAIRATSSIERPNTPTVSSIGACASTPGRGMAPKVGLKPYTPQKEAGRITEPLVCVPTASGTIWQPTAAAEPADDPPGVCAWLCGLRVLLGMKVASSQVTVLPRMTAPAERNAATQAASVSG